MSIFSSCFDFGVEWSGSGKSIDLALQISGNIPRSIADVETKLQLNIATKCWIYVPLVAVIVTMKVFPSWRGWITISLGKCRFKTKKRNEPILVNI